MESVAVKYTIYQLEKAICIVEILCEVVCVDFTSRTEIKQGNCINTK